MSTIPIASQDANTYSGARRAGGEQHRVTRAARAAGRDLLYLTAVLGSSIAGFVVWTVGVSVTLSFIVLVFGAFVWIPAALALRGVATPRSRARQLVPTPARARSLPPVAVGQPDRPAQDRGERSPYLG